MNAQQRRPRASDELYAEVIHVPCPECGVGVDEFCRNSRYETGERAHGPCWRRQRAAREKPVPSASADRPPANGGMPDT